MFYYDVNSDSGDVFCLSKNYGKCFYWHANYFSYRNNVVYICNAIINAVCSCLLWPRGWWWVANKKLSEFNNVSCLSESEFRLLASFRMHLACFFRPKCLVTWPRRNIIIRHDRVQQQFPSCDYPNRLWWLTESTADTRLSLLCPYFSKLFSKLLERLFDPNSVNPSSPENAATLYRWDQQQLDVALCCSLCHKYIYL